MTTSSKRIALITGGSRGLGRSTVLSLAQRGIDSICAFRTMTDSDSGVMADSVPAA
jgi:NAD(P)-dependent dehydrogenase (short-subunit alcohol dehydrogenase family)